MGEMRVLEIVMIVIIGDCEYWSEGDCDYWRL